MSAKTGLSRRALFGCAFGIALTAMASVGNAVILYGNAASATGGQAFQSNWGGGAQSGDTFVLGGPALIDGIGWWGSYSDDKESSTDSFFIRIFDSLAGNAAPVFVCGDASTPTPAACTGVLSSSASLTDNSVHSVYRFDLGLSTPLSLGAGSYLLSITNENPVTDWFWYQGVGDAQSSNFLRSDDKDAWVEDPSGNLALAINGTQAVPEPDTIALTLLAGAALLFARRRVGQAR